MILCFTPVLPLVNNCKSDTLLNKSLSLNLFKLKLDIMCTHMHYIKNKYTGQELLVPCGRCKSCLQEKANYRANRIRVMCKDKLVLFCTLTYTNDCVPYILFDDILDADAYGFRLPVYRDSKVFTRYCNGKFSKRVTSSPSCIISYATVCEDLFDNFDFFGLNCLSHCSDEKVGVCFYQDGVNFIKKLRSNLQRRFNYDGKFSYFLCSEYGSITKRPHFHVVLFCEKDSDYEMWKRAVHTSWSFDDSNRDHQCEIARKPASYVASYVNSNLCVSPLLREPCFRSKHSYSQCFGYNDYFFQLDSLLEMFNKRDFRYPCTRVVDGVPVVSLVPVPRYVISRFFPRFKGFARLDSDSLFNVLERPAQLSYYAASLQYDGELLERTITMLINKQKLWLSLGYSVTDFAYYCSRIYPLYFSSLLRNSHAENDKLLPCQRYQLYDNFSDYLRLNSVPDFFITNLPDDAEFDFNKYSHRVEVSSRYEDLFDKYDKSRKLNNYRDSLSYNV